MTRSRPSIAWVALLGYLLLALALFSSTWVDPAGSWIGSPKDPGLFIWYLGWIPRELAAGHNPLFTDYLSYPDGVNLMWNTSMLVPAVVLWPVTALVGPVVAYNLLITAGIALSAWLAFFAARLFIDRPLPCLVAGLIYGFSPALLPQALGHPHVVVALFPPIALILGHEILVRQRTHPVIAGAFTGIACALQLLTGEELLALTLLIAAMGVAVLALLHRQETRSRVRYAAKAAATAVVAFAIVTAIPLGFQFLGPRRVYGNVQQPDVYVSDLLAFVVPSRFIHLTGNTTENGAYVGIPLAILFLAGVVVGRKRAWVRWTAAMTLVVGVLSMGPHLHVNGQVTPVPLPWMAVAQLPLLGSAVPSRLMVIAFLGIGVVAAGAVAAAITARPAWRLATAVGLIASLASVAAWLPYPSVQASAPAFFRPGGDVEKIAPGAAILVSPFSSKQSTVAMYWQATANYRFKMPEGDAFTPGPYLGPHPSFVESTLDALDARGTVTVTPQVRAMVVAYLKLHGITAIVVGPSAGQSAIVDFFTQVEGDGPVDDGGVKVWWFVAIA